MKHERPPVKEFTPISKMRIMKWGKNGLEDDRLVEQATELRMGPKGSWKGGLTLEFNLSTQTDVEGMIDYIKKLKGDLPIEKKEKKTRTNKLDKMLKDKEPLQDLVKTVEGKCKNQEQLIDELRQYDFRFIAADVIGDMATKEQITILEKHQNWQFMVRLVKEAKVPQNDKWDWRLAFGIKFVGERFNYVVVYLWGKKDHVIKLKWNDEKKMNFKKVEKVYIFPPMMDLMDRRKWRLENRKVIKAHEANQKFEPSKFYKKWGPYIKVH